MLTQKLYSLLKSLVTTLQGVRPYTCTPISIKYAQLELKTINHSAHSDGRLTCHLDDNLTTARNILLVAPVTNG